MNHCVCGDHDNLNNKEQEATGLPHDGQGSLLSPRTAARKVNQGESAQAARRRTPETQKDVSGLTPGGRETGPGTGCEQAAHRGWSPAPVSGPRGSVAGRTNCHRPQRVIFKSVVHAVTADGDICEGRHLRGVGGLLGLLHRDRRRRSVARLGTAWSAATRERAQRIYPSLCRCHVMSCPHEVLTHRWRL